MVIDGTICGHSPLFAVLINSAEHKRGFTLPGVLLIVPVKGHQDITAASSDPSPNSSCNNCDQTFTVLYSVL